MLYDNPIVSNTWTHDFYTQILPQLPLEEVCIAGYTCYKAETSI